MSSLIQHGGQEWEALCQRCGRCCYEKVEFEGTVYYTDIPCQFLDMETNTCHVYAERDKLRPGCVRLMPDHVPRGFLPADCPYVADLKNYKAPVFPDDEAP